MVRNRLLIWAAFAVLVAANVVDSLGVNWGTQASDNLPSSKIAELLKDNNISKIKLFDSHPNTLEAFAGTGIDVMPGIPNNKLKDLATDYDNAKEYVNENIKPRIREGGVDIRYIAVGNEPFLSAYKGEFAKHIFPALKNVQKALHEAGLGDKIKATIPQNADVYSSGVSSSGDSKPSDGDFRSDIRDLMYNIVRFLRDNNSPFLVNIYPYLSLYENPNFPIEYAFFDGNYRSTWDKNNTKYDNMFDANFDTLIWSLRKAGTPNVKIIVGEIGWPTDGARSADTKMAKRFYDGWFKKMAANKGTPLHPGSMEYYLFSLTDENKKSILPGDFERHWGVFTYDGKPKFPVDFTGQGSPKWPVAAKNVEYLEQKWCLLDKDITEINSTITESQGWACVRSDCTSLNFGSTCSKLDVLTNVSYAYNMFFQINRQDVATCDFGGLAKIYTRNASTKECLFPIALEESDGLRLKIQSGVISLLMGFCIFLALL